MPAGLTRAAKEKLIRQVRRRVYDWWRREDPKERGPLSHYCLFWAQATVQVLLEAGLRAQLQAGSCLWRSRSEEDETIQPSNAWGYVFHWDTESLQILQQGLLPEIHIWTAIIQDGRNEIVDPTTGFFKRRCLDAGHPWTAPDPPLFLWADVKEMASWDGRCSYLPDNQAIAIAYALLTHRDGGPLTVPMLRPPAALVGSG